MSGRTLVIGFGNTLRGDDGLGPATIDALRECIDCNRATLVATEILTPELAAALAEARHVIFIDAARDGPVGQVVCQLIPNTTQNSCPAGHQLDPAGLVAMASWIYGQAPKAFLVTYRGYSFELGERLTPALESAIDQIVDEVVRLL